MRMQTMFHRMAGLATVIMGVLLCGIVLSSSQSADAAEPVLHLDPQKVKGPDACGECHKSSVAAWKPSRHATTFKRLPRARNAKAIAKKMGIRRIKSGSDCLSCHFTSAVNKRGKVKPIAGITCESCHGAGSDWINLHSDYGGKGVKKENETPENKAARYQKSEAAGMIRPRRLYAVASNCYQCHTVANEKLVNTGGHTAGSAFELVAWSQGEVRHNVWYSKPNGEASAERKRMMYVVGQALDLEYALRGLAKATESGIYASAMIKRAEAAKTALAKIAGQITSAEVDAMLAAASSAPLELGKAQELAAAAGKVAAAAQKFAGAGNGAELASIDSMLPAAGAYKGTAQP